LVKDSTKSESTIVISGYIAVEDEATDLCLVSFTPAGTVFISMLKISAVEFPKCKFLVFPSCETDTDTETDAETEIDTDTKAFFYGAVSNLLPNEEIQKC
jgi:hypothetical protein